MQREAKRTHWEQVIQDWEGIGQSQKDFCIQRNISYSVFRYWRAKLDGSGPTGMSLDSIHAVEIGRVYKNSFPARALEFDTQGISMSVSGSDAKVTIHGRINIDRLERIIVACNQIDDGIIDHAQA